MYYMFSLWKRKKPVDKKTHSSSIKKKNASFMSLESTRKIWTGNYPAHYTSY